MSIVTRLLAVAAVTVGGANTLSVEPGTVVGGRSATATLTLPQATRGDVTYSIQLSSTDHASAPATVIVPRGMSTAAFMIGTRPVGGALPKAVTVTVAGASAMFLIGPASLAQLVVELTELLPGRVLVGRVSLDGAAPDGGTTVTLGVTSDPRLQGITVPTSVTVPAGQTTASFPVSVASNVTPGTFTLAATLAKVTLKQDIRVP